jgi:lipid-binding SYLF domain-containing protein
MKKLSTCFMLSVSMMIPAMAADEDRAADVTKRLDAADAAFREIMAVPDKGIPHDLLERANCAVVIPGLKKGAFMVGAKYGKGFITCRTGKSMGWSAPASVRVEGGSFGFQIGGGETDVFLLVMNPIGAEKLLKSEFKIGGEASAMAGPVGRTVQAETDALMRAQILGWSRSRGAFAGVSLEGSTLREDKDDNRALYGKDLSNEEIVKGGAVKVPGAAAPLIKSLSAFSYREKKENTARK